MKAKGSSKKNLEDKKSKLGKSLELWLASTNTGQDTGPGIDDHFEEEETNTED